jgi:hypothetical protein
MLKKILNNMLAIAVAIILFAIVGAMFSYLASISLKLIYVILALIGVAIIYIPNSGRIRFGLKKIFGVNNIQDILFDKAPYLCPWYFNETTPKVMRNNELLKWRRIEKIGEEYVGTLLLVDQVGTCYGILKTYTYLLPSPTNEQFLVWARSESKNTNSKECTISHYSTDDLQPIDNHEELVLKFKDSKTTFYHFNSEPKSTISVPLNPDVEYLNYNFPIEFKSFGDLCAIMEIPELYKNGNPQWHNTSILLLKPSEDKIIFYPQDWFNKSDADFGYQWITRAIKNTETGLIHGQGIRISNFILNETNRQR